MTKKFNIVFPGQGSQSVTMLADLAGAFPLVSETFQEASDALRLDLWKMVQQGPAEALNLTHNTQPAMLAAGISVWRVWCEQGGSQPELMAGHSLGEYSALVAADSLGFSDAIKLVAERGRLMQEAVPEGEGAMAAILGLDDERVRELCTEAAESEVVEAVNFNSPGQVVVAGNRSAVDRMVALAKAGGAKRAVPLPVSVPSHCALMRPAAERLARYLEGVEIKPPAIPIIHNVTVGEATTPDEIRGLLAQQLHSPVRWAETIQAMADNKAQYIIEAGPGRVLAGLCKRIDRTVTGLALFDPASLEKAMETINA
ncbi:MAG: ACP S-malonyltransferase [Candidatus Polarisedimenticolaceae bacterium]|nr:ACP S-malonyltransferase [Candidatus Polarisedimenticolaceae bacterium]